MYCKYSQDSALLASYTGKHIQTTVNNFLTELPVLATTTKINIFCMPYCVLKWIRALLCCRDLLHQK